MDLVEMIENRNLKVTELTTVITTGKEDKRTLTEDEEKQVVNLQSEIDDLDLRISEKNEDKKNNRNKNMENFSELIQRDAKGFIENFSVRAVTLATPITNTTVAGNLSEVGYEPFWKSLNVEYLPNLSGNISLPYISTLIAGKKGEGDVYESDATVGTVTLAPKRYTVTEVISKEFMSVANEAAFQAYLFKMVQSVDKAVTKDIFEILTGVTTVQYTGYTPATLDTIEALVDGNITFLMPRAEFYKAKSTKVDTGSGLFVANKKGSFAGELWDGTPLFYSQLFAGSKIICADLSHVTLGEWGSNYEVDFLPIPSKGQVEVTVSKLANVVLRNANAAKGAIIV